ncbi:hyperosmotically inducible protein [Paraburkholderia sp. GAS41]|jgi:hyperosmotically inducible protein
MNLRNRVVCIAATALLSTVAYAQTPAATSDADAAAPAQAPMTKKAVRQANHAFAKRVQQVLYKTKGLQTADIVVFAKAATGQVTLAGFIETEDQDRIAQDAASKVQGVKSVTSKLTLQEQGS